MKDADNEAFFMHEAEHRNSDHNQPLSMYFNFY